VKKRIETLDEFVYEKKELSDEKKNKIGKMLNNYSDKIAKSFKKETTKYRTIINAIKAKAKGEKLSKNDQKLLKVAVSDLLLRAGIMGGVTGLSMIPLGTAVPVAVSLSILRKTISGMFAFESSIDGLSDEELLKTFIELLGVELQKK